MPTPFTTSYSATKFALDGFFGSLRHELIMQKRNVSVTLCILGLIDTASALEYTRYVFICLQEHICSWKNAKKCTATQFKRVCAPLWGESPCLGCSSWSRSRQSPVGWACPAQPPAGPPGLWRCARSLFPRRGKVHLSASPAPEAALAIVRGGAARADEVFYPGWLRQLCCLWTLFPSSSNQVLRTFYNYSSPWGAPSLIPDPFQSHSCHPTKHPTCVTQEQGSSGGKVSFFLTWLVISNPASAKVLLVLLPISQRSFHCSLCLSPPPTSPPPSASPVCFDCIQPFLSPSFNPCCLHRDVLEHL